MQHPLLPQACSRAGCMGSVFTQCRDQGCSISLSDCVEKATFWRSTDLPTQTSVQAGSSAQRRTWSVGDIAANMGRSSPACPCCMPAKPSRNVRAVRTRTGRPSIPLSFASSSLCVPKQTRLLSALFLAHGPKRRHSYPHNRTGLCKSSYI